jgi:hypothetical protein
MQFSATAQQLLPPVEVFSNNKTGHLLMRNGDSIHCTYRGLKTKKKAFVAFYGKNSNGENIEANAEDINVMALPTSKMGKLLAVSNSNSSVMQAEKNKGTKYDRELIYFYSE